MTPPPAPVDRNRVGQGEQVGQPVEHVRLEFGGGGGGGPQHALHPEAGGEQVTEDRRPAGVGREVGEERRVLPVRDAGQDQLVEVGEHGLERLALLGRVRGQRAPELARPTADSTGKLSSRA